MKQNLSLEGCICCRGDYYLSLFALAREKCAISTEPSQGAGRPKSDSLIGKKPAQLKA